MPNTCTYISTHLHYTPPRAQVEQQEPFSPDCTLRTLRVTCTASGATHTLSHYHFHAWPDHGTPDSSSGIRAMCRALAAARASGQPIVVHCSAGIGRTGTFCAIDILLQVCVCVCHFCCS